MDERFLPRHLLYSRRVLAPVLGRPRYPDHPLVEVDEERRRQPLRSARTQVDQGVSCRQALSVGT
jgi:hypothetical protein